MQAERLMLFDGGYEHQAVDGFAARRIPLPATLYDRLDWQASYKIAELAMSRGERVVWDLDLGLFNRLPLSLNDEGQFRACALAVEHLLKEIKAHFLEATLGVCLYRGNGDMRRGFPWEVGGGTEEGIDGNGEYKHLITCRDRCWDFLRQLVVNWPDSLPLFATLDMRRLSLFTQLMLLHRDQLAHFCPIVRGVSALWRFPHLGWEEASESGALSRQQIAPYRDEEPLQQGLLVPSEPIDPKLYAAWEAALLNIEQQSIPTRILTESSLTAEWDGLDRIFVPPEVSLPTKRALQGFIAAGGEVVSLMTPS